MRIALVNSTRKWGGVKTWTLELGSRLTAHGHEVHLFGRPGPFVRQAARAGMTAVECRFGPDFNPLLILRFMRYFSHHPMDVVMVNVGKDLRSAGVAARLMGVPLVQRIGAAGDLRNTWKIRLQYRLLGPLVLTNCLDIKRQLLAKLPFLQDHDISYFHTGKRVADHPPDTASMPRVLVTTNQLVPDKATDQLIKALAVLKSKGYAFVLDVVGAGPEETNLKKLAHDLGVGHDIHWHGYVEDVYPVLRQADLFCLPSLHEGLPNGLLEAMAQGVAPVARGVGGIPEVWPRGLEHMLAAPNAKAEDWATLLMPVLRATDQELAAWKRLAWEKCAADCNLDVQAERIEAWLQTVAQGE